jgi:hypothetical protein
LQAQGRDPRVLLQEGHRFLLDQQGTRLELPPVSREKAE